MSDEQYRQRIQSLEEHTDKLVERGDKLTAQLAERDAEIAALKAELAGVIEGHAAAVEIWGKRDYDQHAEIERLRAQVAELQAWRDAVPIGAIAFLHGATVANLGESWQTRKIAEWADSMPK